MKPRNTFGWIFLVTGLVVFYVLAASSISTELSDVLHGRPFTDMVRDHMPAVLNHVLDKLLPARVQDLPHIKFMNPSGESTNDNPFQQFNVVLWLGWAFVVGAIADVGTSYLKYKYAKTRVEE